MPLNTPYLIFSKLELLGWDVVADAVISVVQNSPAQYVWSANLWYTDLGQKQEYRWCEALYFSHPLYVGNRPQYEPFAVTNPQDADFAALGKINIVALASKVRPIDDEDKEDFYNRWMRLLATAYSGKLQRPSRFPLD